MQDGTTKISDEFRLKDTQYLSEDIHALILELEAEKNKNAESNLKIETSLFCSNQIECHNLKITPKAPELPSLTSDLPNSHNPQEITQAPAKKKRKRGLKHPDFYQYVKFQAENLKYSFTTYLNMMRNMGYVSSNYQSYKNTLKKDNSHDVIQNVSIGLNSANKDIIFFKINGGSQVHEILMNTVEDYFLKAIKSTPK